MEGKYCEWYAIIRRVDNEAFKISNPDVLSDTLSVSIENESHNIEVFKENINRLGYKILKESDSFLTKDYHHIHIQMPVYNYMKAERLLTAMKKRFDASDFSKTQDFIEFLHLFDKSFESV
jgi:hypothetical protein